MPNQEHRQEQMRFDHTFTTAEKMGQAGEGAYSSQYANYITDGEAALQDKIYGNATRRSVITGVTSSLLAEMREANEGSRRAAEDMRIRHLDLQRRMKEALARAKEATRQERRLSADLLVEESKRSREKAVDAVDSLDEMYTEQNTAIEANEALQAGDQELARQKREQLGDQAKQRLAASEQADLTDEDLQKQRDDRAYIRTRKNTAQGNIAVLHHKYLKSLFRAIGKASKRSDIKDRIEENKRIAREQTEYVRREARRWNEIRERVHEKVTFREFYRQYDRAAADYHTLTRERGVGISDQYHKRVQEYVGVFDLEGLNSMLDQLPANPYMSDRKLDIRDKRAIAEGSSNTQEGNIKTHRRMSLLAERGENGLQKRYKVGMDFTTGYEAFRQTFDPDHPTALTAKRRADQLRPPRVMKNAAQMKLFIDAKDLENRFLDTEKNIEIVQAKEKKWFGARTVNGVFLNGRFISAQRDVVASGTDVKTVGLSMQQLRQKANVRRAVLRSQVFRLINSRTIQHMASYDVQQKGAKKEDALIKRMAKDLSVEGQPPVTEAELRASIFSDNYHSTVGQRGHDNGPLPDARTAAWEATLLADDEEAKKALPSTAKTKVLYDVIRQVHAEHSDLNDTLLEEGSRTKRLLDSVTGDRAALKDLCMLLLGDNTTPAYWDIARTICKDVLKKRFSTAVERAQAKRGQIMRVSLMDELEADRSLWNADDILGAIMPTSWKQMSDDVKGERGIKALFKQKLIDGSAQALASGVVGAVVDVKKGLDPNGEGYGRTGDIVKKYSRLVVTVINLQLPVEFSCQLANQFTKDEITKDKDGKDVHSVDTRADMISNAFAIATDVIKVIKQVNKAYKKATKDKDPVEVKKIIGPYMQIAMDCVGILSSMVGTIAQFFEGSEIVTTITDLIKDGLTVIESTVELFDAGFRRGAITETENEFVSAITQGRQNTATPQQREIANVITGNSQLQYGLSCAKTKAKGDQVKSGFKMARGITGLILTVVKNFVPGGKKNPITKVAKATSKTAIGAIELITQICRDRSVTKDNLALLLGDKSLANADDAVINQVLNRELGIASKDYITDLARIFMSINTHVFLQEADGEAEETVGKKVVGALFRQDGITSANLKKVNLKDLMGIMGVEGNFHTILKHSLALRPEPAPAH